MKKGILISSIITIVSYSILALVFLIVGLINVAAKGMADADPGAIPAEELTVVYIVFLALAGYLLLSVIFSGIMIGKRNSAMGKGAGVVLGIFGILFGAIVPGIIFVADSAKNRS
ncbi:MAG: hypothetical protein II721_00245 [Bacilli bacterium]|nr:hypothetical protein [Bacilli bacterium]